MQIVNQKWSKRENEQKQARKREKKKSLNEL